MLYQADQRKGSRRTIAGAPWLFPGAKRVDIEGPEGPLSAGPSHRDPTCSPGSPGCADSELEAVPVVRGRYTVRVDGALETRTVTVDPTEILTQPKRVTGPVEAMETNATEYVSASREVALLLIALFGIELALRIVRRWMQRGAPPASSDLARTT